ncbi:uncharacterized protein LOC134763166 [Penaeus indicus]|uniref:uncharacterized protein LOC134763166 n=1 Tax=Penaeus indicus TaxID=29960 RepID=UPI00300D8CE8
MTNIDFESTIDDLSGSIGTLANKKATGQDCIPAEILKCGKPVLPEKLHLTFPPAYSVCWREGTIPKDMKNAKIVTLCKNKGDRSDCNNYRGISLLSIAGKVFAKVCLKRIQSLAGRVYPESSVVLGQRVSTIDMVFPLRQLQEKCREQQKPLFFAFIGLSKAFDLVSRAGLFKLLKKIAAKCKITIKKVFIGELLFADDDALAAHSESELQRLINKFSDACKPFRLTITFKKTQVLGQRCDTPPRITVDDHETVYRFTYLGSTVSDNLSLDTEIDIKIAYTPCFSNAVFIGWDMSEVWMTKGSEKLSLRRACNREETNRKTKTQIQGRVQKRPGSL